LNLFFFELKHEIDWKSFKFILLVRAGELVQRFRLEPSYRQLE
jgi:hypothetical protein